MTEQAPDDDQIFRTLNRRFLLMAGYSEQQIVGLGDLAKLPYDRMEDLIHKKRLEEAGEALTRQGIKTKLLHEHDDQNSTQD